MIESKFRRAVVRRKGGLEVADNEQFLPLYGPWVSSIVSFCKSPVVVTLETGGVSRFCLRTAALRREVY